jgi:hypothetical protein
VPPGLIGVSQLFTPHGTSKRYRTLIDNYGLRRDGGVLRRLGILACAVRAMVREVTRRSVRQCWMLGARLGGRYSEKRRLRRVMPPGAVVHLGRRTARLLDMNEETLLVEFEHEPLERRNELVLDIPVLGQSRAAHRTAHCRGDLLDYRRGPGRTRWLFKYEPVSARSEYMIQQYFLRGSLAQPRRLRPEPAPWTSVASVPFEATDSQSDARAA